MAFNVGGWEGFEKYCSSGPSRSEGKLSNYLPDVFTIYCFFHHWSKRPRGKRKKSVCYYSANEGWSLFRSHYCDATSAISHQTPNNLHSPNSHIEEPVSSEAIQVLNKGSNNTCITLVCYAVTCLCILWNFPMKLKQKSCNAMSDNSITVTNNMKLMRNTIYRPLWRFIQMCYLYTSFRLNPAKKTIEAQ